MQETVREGGGRRVERSKFTNGPSAFLDLTDLTSGVRIIEQGEINRRYTGWTQILKSDDEIEGAIPRIV